MPDLEYSPTLRNLVPCVHYMGFSQTREYWTNKRILRIKGRVSDPIQTSPGSLCCRAEENHRHCFQKAPWPQPWLWDSALHPASLSSLTWKRVTVISHITKSFKRPEKGEGGGVDTISMNHHYSQGTMAWTLSALSCLSIGTWLGKTIF